MKKKLLMVLISVSMIASVFTGCGNSTEAKDSGKAQTEQADTKEDSADKADEEQAALEDGTYTAEFQTDSSMFHVNEAMDGKGTLTVEDGKMTIHISLVSKNIVNLFEGTAEDAQKDGAELRLEGVDTVIVAIGVRSNKVLEEALGDQYKGELYVVGDAKKAKNGYLGIQEGFEAGMTV